MLSPTPICAMCSSAWSMDTRSIDSMSCCRGTGSLRRLSRPEGMCNLCTLTNKSTFDRWLKVLNAVESAREDARRRRKRTREPVSGDKRNKAVQAFWAMHVEALNWSGLTAKDYANAHHISVYSLRTWRARLDATPLQVDWRARLHPSVLPIVSTSGSDSAKEPQVGNILTNETALDSAPA